MLFLHTSRLAIIFAGLSVAILCPSMYGMERVNLRSGDTMNCSHHEMVDADHVRLFFVSKDSAQTDNYQVLPASMIVSFETIPDPPTPPVVQATAPAPVVAQPDVPTLLVEAGTLRNIDVDLLAAVVKAESGGHSNAVSRTGARGLMQLMPGTALELGVSDAFRPDQNIAGGSKYLDILLTRYHDRLDLALAAYNAGPAAVDRYHGIPPFRETRAYVARVEREFVRRKLVSARTVTAAVVAH